MCCAWSPNACRRSTRRARRRGVTPIPNIGVVRATLEIEPGLPPEYRAGVFAQQRSYPAWVRFSNGSGVVQPDKVPDGRGVGLKLMDVPGSKLLDDEADAKTQDFLFINHDVFFVKDAKDYVELFRIVTRDTLPTKFFIGLNPFKWRLTELKNAKNIRVQIANPLDVRYWSMVPIPRPASNARRSAVAPGSRMRLPAAPSAQPSPRAGNPARARRAWRRHGSAQAGSTPWPAGHPSGCAGRFAHGSTIAPSVRYYKRNRRATAAKPRGNTALAQ